MLTRSLKREHSVTLDEDSTNPNALFECANSLPFPPPPKTPTMMKNDAETNNGLLNNVNSTQNETIPEPSIQKTKSADTEKSGSIISSLIEGGLMSIEYLNLLSRIVNNQDELKLEIQKLGAKIDGIDKKQHLYHTVMKSNLGMTSDIITSFVAANYRANNTEEGFMYPELPIMTDERFIAFNNDCLNANYMKQMVRISQAF
jgi:hypothetical protein